MSASDTAHDIEPSNWASLIWRLTKGRPAFWMFAFFCLYFAFRVVSDVDPLDRIIHATQQKLNFDTAVVSPPISGEWDYVASDTTTGEQWGGLINISFSKEGKIEKITVRGKRTWKAADGKSQHVEILPPVPWEADGAAYLVDKNQVQWHYLTHENTDRTIQGVTFVNANEGKLEGWFSDLWDPKPRWGFMELQRRSS